MGKGTPQTTNSSSSVEIPPWLSSAYLQLASQAQNVASQPFTPYPADQFVAPFTTAQNNAMTNAGSMALGNVPGLGGANLGYASTNYGTAAQLPQVGAQVAMNALPYFQGAGDMIGQAPGYIAGAGGMIQQGQGYLSQGADYLNQGKGYLDTAMGGVSAANALAGQATNALHLMPYDVEPYMSPYIQDVVNKTQGQFNNQNSIQGNSLIGQAIAAGNAFGGDRAGVAQAQLAGQQQIAQAPVIAGLYDKGFINAQNEFNVQQAIDLQSQQLHNQNLLSAAGIGMQGAGIGVQGAGVMGQYGGIMGQLGATQGQLGSQYGALGSQLANIGSAYGNVGAGVANTGGLLGQLGGQLGSIAGGQGNIGLGMGNLAGNANNSLFTTGSAQQGTNQALLTDQYNQFLAQQGYPFQTTGWLGNLLTGLGAKTGSTTTGSSATTPASNPLSTAAGLGLGLFSALSDERAKENMKKVGESDSGQPIYKYNYKGSPTTQLGFSAQETEQRKPEAVTEDGSGLKHVDYDVATAKRDGGAVASGKQALLRAIAEARSHRQHLASGGAPSYVNAPGYVPQSQSQPGGGVMTSNFTPPGLMNTQSNSTAELNKLMKALAPKIKGWFGSDDATPSAATGSGVADAGIDAAAAFVPGSEGATDAGGFDSGGGTDYSNNDEDNESATPIKSGNIGYTALINALNQERGANNIIAQMTRSYAEGGGIDAEESTDDSGAPEDTALLDAAAPTQGRYGALRPAAAPPGAAPEAGGGLFNMTPTMRQALLATAAGMLSANTPHFGQALGAGVSQGLQQYKTAEALSLAAKREQRQIEHQNAALAQNERSMTLREKAAADRLEWQKGQLKRAEDRQGLGPGMRRNAEGVVEDIPGYNDTLAAQAIAKAQTEPLTPEAKEVSARQLINGDYSGMPSFRGKAGETKVTQIKNLGTEILMGPEYGLSAKAAAEHMGEQLQSFKARGVGLSAEERTLATRQANLGLILRVTNSAIPAALEASENVDRVGWRKPNEIIQSGQVMADSPELKKFGMANLQLAEGWARAMNPTGIMRESDRDLALKFLSTAENKTTYRGLAMQLKTQIDRELEGAKEGRIRPPGAARPVPGAASEEKATPAAAKTEQKTEPARGGPKDGDTATGPNGQKVIRQNGKWVPLT